MWDCATGITLPYFLSPQPHNHNERVLPPQKPHNCVHFRENAKTNYNASHSNMKDTNREHKCDINNGLPIITMHIKLRPCT